MNEMWAALSTGLRDEVLDIVNPEDELLAAFRLLVAVLLGAVLGYEREIRGTTAGLRTHMLVALGAALFIVVPVHAGMLSDDLSRVLQGLISGIGFLGAGAIIKLSEDRQVKGLTTAASVWLTASIGVAVGMGQHVTAVVATVFGLLILVLSSPAKGPERE